MRAGGLRGLGPHPSPRCVAQALKALALHRLGRHDEAQKLAAAACAGISSPVDEGLVSALSHFFKEARDPQSWVGMCERVYAANPGNESAGVQLFNAHVRMNDLAKQQILALRLQRQFPQHQRDYVIWAIVSILLQARAGGPADRDTALKQVQLAQMMLHKAGGPMSYGELNLLIASWEIKASRTAGATDLPGAREPATGVPTKPLVTMPAAADVLAALDEHKALMRGRNAEYASLRATCEAHLGRFEAAKALREEVLVADGAAENWHAAREWAESALRVAMGAEGLDPLDDQGALSEAARAVLGSVRRMSTRLLARRPSERTATLLNVHVLSRLARAVNTTGDSGMGHGLSELRDDLAGAVMDYIEAHGHRFCCFLDVRAYLPALGPEAARRALFDRAAARWGNPLDASSEETMHACAGGDQERTGQRLVTLCRIFTSMGLGRALDQRGRRAAALALVRLQHTLPLAQGEEPGPVQESIAPGLALSAASLWQQDVCPTSAPADLLCAPRLRGARPGGGLAHVGATVAATLTLESALMSSPTAYQLRLRLTLLYMALGATGAAMGHFKGLSLRRLQQESMAYLMLPGTLVVGDLETARKLINDALSAHAQAEEETADSCALPFKYGNPETAFDLADLRDRLRLSRSHATHLLARALVDVAGLGVTPAALAAHLNGLYPGALMPLPGGGAAPSHAPRPPSWWLCGCRLEGGGPKRGATARAQLAQQRGPQRARLLRTRRRRPRRCRGLSCVRGSVVGRGLRAYLCAGDLRPPRRERLARPFACPRELHRRRLPGLWPRGLVPAARPLRCGPLGGRSPTGCSRRKRRGRARGVGGGAGGHGAPLGEATRAGPFGHGGTTGGVDRW